MKMDEYKFFGDCLASGLLRITRFVGAILFIFFLLLGIVQAKSGNFENQIAYGGKGVSVKLLDDQEISGELLSVDDSILYLGAGTSFNDLAWRVNLNEVRIIELLEKDNILKGLKIGVGSGCVLSGIILIMSLSEGANNPLDLIVFPIGAAILVGILVGGGSLIGTTVGYLSSSKETEYYLLSDSEKYTFIKRLELLCKYIYLPSDYLIKDFRIRPGVITTETKHQYSNDENWQPSEKYSVGSVATTKSGKKKNPRHFALSLGYERNWALFSIRDEAYDYVVSAGFGDSRPLPDFPHSVEYHHGDQDYNHLSLSCEYVTSKRFTFGK